jgi:hypothetical protein
VTKRAVIIGVVFAVVLCSITYFNQSVMRQTALVGNYFPVSVYGTLILVVLLLNPALARLRTGCRLEGRELAVILALVLAACGVAESGFLKTFTNVAMLPHHYRRTNPGWDREGTFERLPSHFLAETGENDEALGGFLQGRASKEPMSLTEDVPWAAWARPLLTWLPLAIVIMAGVIGLALVVHRQWAEHEHLPYPLATFARSLWAKEGEASVLSHRWFWVAAGVVLAIHMANFAYTWWPQHTVQVPTRFDFYPIARLFPTFAKGRLAWNLSQLRIFFSVLGFAYLVSSDVSLSFGIAPFIYTIFDGILVAYGVSTMAGGEHRASIYTSLNLGSFVAFVAVIVYFGRRHYWAVLRSCFGLRSADPPRPHETWGMRTFVGCSAVATILMVSYGLAWPFAIIYMLTVVVFYVAVSRVVAESGLFFMKPAWVPHIMLLGLFGGYALGPTAALIAMFFSAVLFAEARETVMPYVVNSLGLLSREKVKLGRVAAWAGGAAALGLVVGLVVMLCLQHDRGTDMAAGGWFTRWVPSYPFDISTDISLRLRGQGKLAESDALPSCKRPFAAKPERKFMISLVVGAALVILCYVGRIHVRKWPIHPAVFMLWNWYHVSTLTFSFLLGWAIKTGVAKYGGWGTVQRVKPLMIGLIAGDMLGALVPAIISAVYYLASGELPPSFKIMP